MKTTKSTKQSTRKPSLRSLDALFSKAVRIRDNYTCQRCFVMYREGSPGLHASHYVGRANRQLRWTFSNADSFCNGCHQYMETHKATLYRDWKMAQLGEDRYLALVERSRQIRKWKPDELRELRKELQQLCDGG